METLQDTLKKLAEIKETAKAMIQDESLSLEERWQLLIQNPDLGETSLRTDFGLNRDDSFLYDGPLYMQKYETRSVGSILECLKEDEYFELTVDEEIVFKYYCVSNNISRMKFDW
jgi:hypothetical protein